MADEPLSPRRYHGRGLHGSLVEHLGQRIVSGEPVPGEALPQEPRLASEYDVSRTVVREALRVLAAKGLVDARPMRGTRVRPRADWRLLDPDLLRWSMDADGREALLEHLLEIRLLVEPAAARLAAERARSHQRALLDDAIAALESASADVSAFIEADLALHAAVFEATANPVLAELIAPIEAALRMGRQVQARVADGQASGLAPAIEMHRAVVRAICAGDGTVAEDAMRELVTSATRDARHVLGSGIGRSDG